VGGSLEAITAALLRRVGEADIDPTLERIRPVLELLGEPQRCAPVIHITGTNGKTSTARMVESLLRALGLRTGLYTSPHLVSITERIRIDGEPLDEDRFAALYEEVAPLIDLVEARQAPSGQGKLSFFEAVTALAFAAFADAPVDVMILEVGMGGTWDATNLADGAVAVVAPIGLDHTEYLGDTLAEIAGEKAGIIKPGAVAVLSHQPEEAAQVLLQRCVEVGAKIAREGLEFGVVSRAVAVGGQSVTLQGLRGRYDEVFLPLFGAHQAGNAALALAAVEALVGTGEALSDELVRQGFADASSPGRLEVLRSSPSVILDAAHNPAGGGVLAEALQDSFSFAGVVGVLAVLADKDVEGLLEALEPVLDHVVCTTNRSPRALPAQRLADLAEPLFGGHRVEVAEDLATAIDQAMAWADEHSVAGPTGVVVTGSVVTVGAARALLRGGS
jgi:dihydrofolate synthase/folylpolyglutamate synthase